MIDSPRDAGTDAPRTAEVPRVDGAPPPQPDAGALGDLPRARTWLSRARRSRARAALVGVVLLALAGALVGIVRPFGSPAAPTASRATSTYVVTRETLTSQTQVTATLGYSGSYTVSAPSGTPTQDLLQAQEAVAGDRAKVQGDEAGGTGAADAAAISGDEQSLAADQSTLEADQTTLQTGQSTLAADRQKEAVDCAGAGSTSQTCADDVQQVASDEQQVASDEQKVAADRTKAAQDQARLGQDRAKQSQDGALAQSNLSADEAKLAGDEAALAAADEQATIESGAVSQLPVVGQVVTEGQTLYSVVTTPVVLLYGTTPAARNLYEGESGPDVAELNADLRSLGYPSAPVGDAFTSGTAAAVDAFEAHIGVPETGNLALGQVVFLPGPARVTSVSALLGAVAQPGAALLTASSTARQVSIALDANLAPDVKVGDHVTITLPDQRTTPGVVSFVSTVATTPSSGTHSTHSSTPTVEVDVTPTDAASVGDLDQAPVTVSITNASVANALVVPVNALLALEGGGYALEVVPLHGPHRLVPVSTGLFDDAAGLVQVHGSQIHAGVRVAVPST